MLGGVEPQSPSAACAQAELPASGLPKERPAALASTDLVEGVRKDDACRLCHRQKPLTP
jgi:hypothetical protein